MKIPLTSKLVVTDRQKHEKLILEGRDTIRLPANVQLTAGTWHLFALISS